MTQTGAPGRRRATTARAMARWLPRGAAASRAAAAVAHHPRHLVLAALVGGLLAARLPGWVVVPSALGALLAATARRIAPPIALGIAGAMLLGATWAEHRATALDRTALGPLLGSSVSGAGTLVGELRADRSGGARAMLRWRGEPVLLRLPSWMARPAGLDIGSIVDVRGRLRPPDDAARRVRAHAVLDAGHVRPTGDRRGGASGVLDGVRRRARAAIMGALAPAEGGLLVGMALGLDGGLPPDLRDAMQAAGLTHLVAASGANIALLAALVLGVGAMLGIGIRGRWALVVAAIALYVPLAGSGPSIQRAGVMGVASVAAALAGRPAHRWYALLLAGAVTLALDPRAAADVGWQLSFAAVVGIAVLAAPVGQRLRARGIPGPVADAIAVTAAASLATAGLIALHFGTTSPVSLPANVLAAPLVGPTMWLGLGAVLLGQVSVAAAALPAEVAAVPLAALIVIARTGAALPGAQVAAPAALVTAACALLAAALAWRSPPRAWRATCLAGALLVASLVALTSPMRRSLAPPPGGTLRVLALDVGQGDATLLQVAGHAILVDAGPVDGSVVAGLRAAGVSRLDAVLATHGASDHLGGLPAVLRALPVGLVLDGRDGDRSPVPAGLDRAAHAAGVRVVPVGRGQRIRAGALELEVLWPPPRVTAFSDAEEPNDRAVVALATAFGKRVLLTADAESPILAPLRIGPVDVLKVAHHGSADDGLRSLLHSLRPRAALIEVGRRNAYGHPTVSTLQALRAVPTVLRTDRDGTAGLELARDGRAWVVEPP